MTDSSLPFRFHVYPQDRDSLENDITLEEVKGAMEDLKPGRAPREDGFPSVFYKKYSEVLAPKLLYVYQNALGKDKLPERMRTDNQSRSFIRNGKTLNNVQAADPFHLVMLIGKY